MIWRSENVPFCYRDVELFLADMRKGEMKPGYRLSEETFLGLAELVNMDAVVAKEIMDNGVLLLVTTASGTEIEGLMAMAEVCRG